MTVYWCSDYRNSIKQLNGQIKWSFSVPQFPRNSGRVFLYSNMKEEGNNFSTYRLPTYLYDYLGCSVYAVMLCIEKTSPGGKCLQHSYVRSSRRLRIFMYPLPCSFSPRGNLLVFSLAKKPAKLYSCRIHFKETFLHNLTSVHIRKDFCTIFLAL